jgi:hypothetical protein
MNSKKAMPTNCVALIVLALPPLSLCLLASPRAVAEPLTLPAGMSIPLELQLNVNSAYTPLGSPVYFRVARDVLIADKVLIAKDTLVTGKMEQAQDRGMVGRSGSMTVGAHDIAAVDGTRVGIEADLSKQGRSRTGAAVGWILFWGIPGLVTHGVNPYMLKGTEITATTLTAATIDPAKTIAAVAAPIADEQAEITGHLWGSNGKSPLIAFDIERKTDLKTIAFQSSLNGSTEASDLQSMELLAVDGTAIPEPVHALLVNKGAVVFDGWSIARLCRDGNNSLAFGGVDSAGKRYLALYQLHVTIKKKS